MNPIAFVRAKVVTHCQLPLAMEVSLVKIAFVHRPILERSHSVSVRPARFDFAVISAEIPKRVPSGSMHVALCPFPSPSFEVLFISSTGCVLEQRGREPRNDARA